MPRFFCDNINNSVFTINGEDAKHISKVLRIAEGDYITLCDMRGNDYKGKITLITAENVQGDVIDKTPCINEPNFHITLYMAMPKGDKPEFIVQKAVELGATEIVFMLSKRCVSRPDSKTFMKKNERFNKIAFEAAKQCGRGIIPKVRGLLTFKEALEDMNGTSQILFYENATAPLRDIISGTGENISIIIGSEGGFEEEEITEAMNKNIPIASLGNRILRCETAPIVALSAIMYGKGEF